MIVRAEKITSERQCVTFKQELLNTVIHHTISKIHSDMDILRYELKSDMAILKEKIKAIEHSVEFTQADVQELREDANIKEKKIENLQKQTEEFSKRMEELAKRLKEEEEKNTNLEQYTRRENLRFNNIPEVEREDCKALVYDIIDRDLEIE